MKFIETDAIYKNKLHHNYEYTVGQVIWAARFEMARTVEDVLARRFRLLFLDAQGSIDIAEKVASILQKELNKTGDWKQNQVEKFTTLAKGYLI